MTIVKELIASFGFAFDESKLQQFDAGIESLTSKIKALGAGLVIFEGFKKGFAIVDDLVAQNKELSRTAAALGMSKDAYQELSLAANYAGKDLDGLRGAFMILERQLAMAGELGGAQAKKFGIAVKDSDGNLRDSRDVLLDIADKVKNAGSESERMAIQYGLLGRAGGMATGFLRLGREEIVRLGVEAKKTGAYIDSELSAELQDDATKSAQLKLYWQGLRIELVRWLLPAVGLIEQGMRKFAESIKYLTDYTYIFQSIAAVLAAGTLLTLISRFAKLTEVVTKFVLLNKSFLLWAAALTVIVLLVDDLWTLFTGGKSLIGTLLDKFLGFGTAAQYVKLVKEEIKGLYGFIQDSGSVLIDGLLHPLDALNDILMSVANAFGTVVESAMALIGVDLKLTKFKAEDFKLLSARNLKADRGGNVGEEPWGGMMEGTAAGAPGDLVRQANPYAGRPTTGAVERRAEAPGLFSPLVSPETRGYGKALPDITAEQIRANTHLLGGLNREQESAGIPVSRSVDRSKTITNQTAVTQHNNVNLTVTAPDGRITAESERKIRETVEGILQSNIETARRSLRTSSSPL